MATSGYCWRDTSAEYRVDARDNFDEQQESFASIVGRGDTLLYPGLAQLHEEDSKREYNQYEYSRNYGARRT
jgi:hypothetical protein